MHVFGTRENEKAGSILFTGAMEECKKYVHEHLNDSNWYELNICDESGTITERIITAEPFRR